MYVWRRLWKSHLIQNALLQGACSAKRCASESAPEAAARGQSTDLDPGFVKDLQDGPLFRLPLAAPAGAITPVAARATPLRD